MEPVAPGGQGCAVIAAVSSGPQLWPPVGAPGLPGARPPPWGLQRTQALVPGEAAGQNPCRGHAGATAMGTCDTRWHPPREPRAAGSQSESAVLTRNEALIL